MNHVGVDLLERDELVSGGADGGLKPAAILEDGVAGVPIHVTEIEDLFRCKLAEATGASAEAMDEPGKPGERLEFENLQATRFAKAPGRSDWRKACGRSRAGARGFAEPRRDRGSFPCRHDITSIIGAVGNAELARGTLDARLQSQERHNSSRAKALASKSNPVGTEVPTLVLRQR